MRAKYDWRSASRDNYKDFCKKHPDLNVSKDEWLKVIYEFNMMIVEHMLETGEKVKLPFGIGEFAINKRKKKKVKMLNGKEFIDLPVDWKKTREKGKIIYNFNFHTEGFSFKWKWFKNSARFKYSDLFYFKASRVNSRLLTHYLTIDENYQHKYATWNFN